ncbi:TraR/DksA C4-type zinc finger protein [Glaciihabitans sp. dw_435]|uniref:TraR/DksA family transcriptional regulator n=1 Tax=Glaciihabitans sp. dw_435 TaxID=2720081 RepID=UPI0021034508|nr:TraR/DksA C4-type zinc finger protein [Glaciihabitans sp. dw_435]
MLIDRLNEEMGAFLSARRDSPTDDEHDPEGPTLAFERSQSSAMLKQSAQHLSEIDAALVRLEDGTYGLCGRCGKEIASGRLEARPQAHLCIVCAAQVR